MALDLPRFIDRLLSDTATTWDECPPISDVETWAIDTLVAQAWDDCLWEETLPEPIALELRAPGVRFGVLNLLYRRAVHQSPTAPLRLWRVSWQFPTEIGCTPAFNGCGLFVRQLLDAAEQVQPDEIDDVAALRWESTAAATILLWDRFDALLQVWSQRAPGREPLLVRLKGQVLRCVHKDLPISQWAELCSQLPVAYEESFWSPLGFRQLVKSQLDEDAIGDLANALDAFIPAMHPDQPVDGYSVALAEWLLGTATGDGTRLARAAVRLRVLGSAPWFSSWDSIDVPSTERRGTVASQMSAECYFAACLAAEGAARMDLWQAAAEEWCQRHSDDGEAARAMANCLSARGLYDSATDWRLRSLRMKDGNDSAAEVSHLIQLATSSRLDRLGRALTLTTQGLGQWAERKLRPLYKDAWRVTGAATNGTPEGESPDLREIQRLLQRNRTVFAGLAHKIDVPLNRLVRVRNKWAHQQRIPLADIEAGLADAEQLLRIVSAPEAEAVASLRMGLQ
ncbi:MAG: Swt1 family HEPN domain-containing protein [Vicinamibacterales bacterium]